MGEEECDSDTQLSPNLVRNATHGMFPVTPSQHNVPRMHYERALNERDHFENDSSFDPWKSVPETQISQQHAITPLLPDFAAEGTAHRSPRKPQQVFEVQDNAPMHFTPELDIVIIQEAIQNELFKLEADKKKTKQVWSNIAVKLHDYDRRYKSATQRNLQERFNNRLQHFETKNWKNLRKSGTSEQYQEVERLLTDFVKCRKDFKDLKHGRMVECDSEPGSDDEHAQKQKKEASKTKDGKVIRYASLKLLRNKSRKPKQSSQQQSVLSVIQDLTALHKKHMANQYGISFEEDCACNDSQKPDGNHMSIDQVLVAAQIPEKYKGEIAEKLEENGFFTALSLKGLKFQRWQQMLAWNWVLLMHLSGLPKSFLLNCSTAEK